MTTPDSQHIQTQPTDQPLLIIYTGGTIGMQDSKNGYIPCAGIDELINQSLSSQGIKHLQPYKVHEFDQLIDSSNAQPKDWLEIAQCIIDHYHQYSGFIVLHGTDTMAYTAAALHHLFGRNTKPIIVTGSQIPMSNARSDATANLTNAASFARSSLLTQVGLCFAGSLFAGNYVKKVHSSAIEAFASPNSEPLARANIDLSFSAHSTAADLKSLPIEHIKQQLLSAKLNTESNSVSVLFLHPGINDKVIEAAFSYPQTKAIVMLSYGAGNPPDHNKHLIDSLKQAQKNNQVIINMTQCYAGSVSQGTYAVGSTLSKLGVISADNRTLEDVVTDLYLNLAKYQQHNN